MWLPFGTIWLPFGTLWAPFCSILVASAPFCQPFGAIVVVSDPFRAIFLPNSYFGVPESANHLQMVVCAPTACEFSLAPRLSQGPGAEPCRRQLRSARGRWPTSVFKYVEGFLLCMHSTSCISPCTHHSSLLHSFSCYFQWFSSAIRLGFLQIDFLQVNIIYCCFSLHLTYQRT